MKSFNKQEKKKEIVHTKKSESITTSDFTNYSNDKPFYKSIIQLYYPDNE